MPRETADFLGVVCHNLDARDATVTSEYHAKAAADEHNFHAYRIDNPSHALSWKDVVCPGASNMMSFRPVEEGDFPMLLEWLQRPHVKEWWNDEDDSLEKVAAHYSSDPDTTFRYIVIDGKELPLGYIQYYLEPDDVVGIDMFIGEPGLLGRGLGTEIVAAFVDLIDARHGPKTIVIDPDPENMRAIRCYEKAGFKFERLGTNGEGKTAYFMTMARRTLDGDSD